MNKKIPFSRPQKPLPKAADDWVSGGDASAEDAKAAAPADEGASESRAAKPKQAVKAAAKKRKQKAAPGEARPVVHAAASRTVPRPAAGLSDIRWAERMLASVERQAGFVSERLARAPLAGAGEDARAAALRAEILDQARRIIGAMEALRKQVSVGK